VISFSGTEDQQHKATHHGRCPDDAGQGHVVRFLCCDLDRSQVDCLLLRGVREALISKDEDAEDDERDAQER
jgi:hypothetical protein